MLNFKFQKIGFRSKQIRETSGVAQDFCSTLWQIEINQFTERQFRENLWSRTRSKLLYPIYFFYFRARNLVVLSFSPLYFCLSFCFFLVLFFEDRIFFVSCHKLLKLQHTVDSMKISIASKGCTDRSSSLISAFVFSGSERILGVSMRWL